MIRLLALIFFLLALGNYCFANGLGDFANTTPEGNQIADPGGEILLLLKSTNKELQGLKKWYFYKGNIMIELHDSSYAVCNEKEQVILRFETVDKFNSFRQKNGLRPNIWTRWYSGNWITTDFLFQWMPFLILMFIPMLIIWRLATGRLEFNPIVKRIFGVALLALLLLLILDYYPQSF